MTETFDADWLGLREPADHAARPAEILDMLRHWAADREPLRVVDLGSGTGSNVRFLAPRLPEAGQWLLIDHDEQLLARACASAGAAVQTTRMDLADGARLHVLDADLITASALLDLVGEQWLRTLAAVCAGQAAAGLFALSYDGVIEWTPALPADDAVRVAVNAHQRRDKGFGPALGPAAAAQAAAAFEALGYRVLQAESPWDLGPEQAALQEQLMDGWADAALEQSPAMAEALADWQQERRRLIRAGLSRVRVGHVDLLAVPPDP
ncbi:SAM-dependent methyltransferase [Natronocella acetinitrilica]|uniref:SAM-dependent methyltransferase n=1 Tax=Natronocella acetinitrilica TaxID=414046 RepID=A0AAE3KBE0_9GAMM|nr:class I SAM-dependent methyltransferase [Natronocella acetinitrilica]MCP1673473.1 SAM-dependent methyltransferase [Natronocella acetinitrilica]